MKTVCTHCHKWFQVHDRALGKRAKCKSCGGVFVVRPEGMDEIPMREVAPPPRMGSTTQMQPAVEPAQGPADPLAALADAADDSQHDHTDYSQQRARERESFLTHREHGEKGRPAPGTFAALVLGIVAMVLVFVTALGLGVVALFGKAVTGLMVGLSAPGVVGGLVAVFAILQGNSARRRIRRSRGVLAGRGPATAGMLLGWGAVLVLCLVALVALIVLFRHGPIVNTTEQIVN